MGFFPMEMYYIYNFKSHWCRIQAAPVTCYIIQQKSTVVENNYIIYNHKKMWDM